jgi:glycosyltransferase involved in cell wall biosynthesis
MTFIEKQLQIINNKEDKFETFLFLPSENNLERYGEGGLRKKNIFKNSYPDKPLISVVTTNLNNNIERTILSVIDQKYENTEFIIKDGGSDKKTLRILNDYDDQIDYWVSEKDFGIWDGTNRGLKLATGDYIVLLDSGDIFNEGAIKNILELIKKNPDADCLLGSCLKKRLMHGYRPKDITYHFNIFASCSGAFFLKKKAYKKIGLYNTKYICSADYDLFYKMIVKHKMLGVCCDNNKILSIKASGGFSENYSFFNMLLEECIIRFDNKQNIFIILFIFFGRCLKKLIHKLNNFDGNIQSKAIHNNEIENEIIKARTYSESISKREKHV